MGTLTKIWHPRICAMNKVPTSNKVVVCYDELSCLGLLKQMANCKRCSPLCFPYIFNSSVRVIQLGHLSIGCRKLHHAHVQGDTDRGGSVVASLCSFTL